jgi:hypothetical protein
MVRDLNADRRTGQVILVVHLTAILLLVGGGLVQHLVTWGREGSLYLIARLSLIALLCFSLYRGSRVARWLAVGLFALLGLIGLWLASREPDSGAGVYAAQAVLCLSFAAVLVGSSRVHAFLSHQRAVRRAGSGAAPAAGDPPVRPPDAGVTSQRLKRCGVRRVGFLAALVVSVGAAAYLYSFASGWVESRRTYAAEYDRTREGIRELEGRPPAGFDPGCWRAAVVWSHNAYCETFMFKLAADRDALHRFGAGFRERAGREPGPDLLEWIWDELAQASPRGAFYVGKYRGDFRANLECARNPPR